MFRKRRQPTPHFRLPPPYQPITGEQAPLMVPGVHPHCAMMQVAAEDTHVNYVICRGYDPRIRKFYDYDAGDLDNNPGLAVAKPYGNRATGIYAIGEVFPALLPLSRIGQNPGRIEDGGSHYQGQPLNATDEVIHLTDDNSQYINWMLIDSPGARRVQLWARTQANWNKGGGDPYVSSKQLTDGRTGTTEIGDAFNVYLPRCGREGDPNVVSAQNIPYTIDDQGDPVCDATLDARIGSVRMWVGDKADIPTGWGLMDGVENAAGNGGTGFAMVYGATDQYFPLATDVDSGGGNGAVGTHTAKDGTVGANTQTIDPHPGVDVAALLDDHNVSVIDAHAADVTGNAGAHAHGGATGDAGAHNHTGATGSDGDHTHSGVTQSEGAHDHGGATGSASGTTGSSTTGITAQIAGASETATGFADLTDPVHNHTDGGAIPVDEGTEHNVWDASLPSADENSGVTANGHVHDVSGITVAITDPGHTHSFGAHTHTISSDGAHYHVINVGDLNTVAAHTHTITTESVHYHTISQQASHAHTTPEHTHSGTLPHTGSGSLPHSPIQTVPEFVNLMFIERLDNSV